MFTHTVPVQSTQPVVTHKLTYSTNSDSNPPYSHTNSQKPAFQVHPHSYTLLVHEHKFTPYTFINVHMFTHTLQVHSVFIHSTNSHENIHSPRSHYKFTHHSQFKFIHTSSHYNTNIHTHFHTQQFTKTFKSIHTLYKLKKHPPIQVKHTPTQHPSSRSNRQM